MSKILRNPFALIRQAVSHAKFEDSETRERINTLIDEIETELDRASYEFDDEGTIKATAGLQSHLVELLQFEEEADEAEEVRLSSKISSIRGGELDDNDETFDKS